MVRLSLDVKKGDFVWIGFLIVLVGVGFVYAYNANFEGGQPAVMGHSADEIMVNDSSGNSVSLQSLINSGGFGSIAEFGSVTSEDSLGDALVAEVVYLAGSDGFLCFNTDDTNFMTVTLNIGSSNPPSLQLLKSYNYYAVKIPFCSPIAKDEYVEIFKDEGSVMPIYWRPLGSGNLVKQ